MLVSELMAVADEDYDQLAAIVYKATGDSQYLDVEDDYVDYNIIKVGLSATLTWPEGYVINDVDKMMEALGNKGEVWDYDLQEDNEIRMICASWAWAPDYNTFDDYYMEYVEDLKGFEGNTFDNVMVSYNVEMDLF
jgi:hypothetical protein